VSSAKQFQMFQFDVSMLFDQVGWAVFRVLSKYFSRKVGSTTLGTLSHLPMLSRFLDWCNCFVNR